MTSSPSSPLPESDRANTSLAMTNSPIAHSPTTLPSDRRLATDADTFSRTVLTLTEAELAGMDNGLLTGEPNASMAGALTAVLGAINPLLDMVTYLRSPAGDWPAGLPWTPENVYPYAADEAYEVCNAYESALTSISPSPPVASAIAPAREWTLQDLAPRLLWAIAHSGAAVMNLLSGVTAAIQTPQGEWQGGLLRLVVILTARPTTVETEAWAVDLAIQRPPLPGVPADRPLRIYTPLPSWTDGTAAQLLTQVHTLIEQDFPNLTAWLRGIPGDWLIPGSPWQSGTLTLHCELEFIPLPTLVPATGGDWVLGLPPVPTVETPSLDSPQPPAADLTQSSTQPVTGISVPLSLFDWARDTDREAEGDIEGETTIFFLDEEEDLGDNRLDDDELEDKLDHDGNLDREVDPDREKGEHTPADRHDLMPPFPPTPLADDANVPDSVPLTASSLFDDVAEGDRPAPPTDLPQSSPVAMPDLGTLEAVPEMAADRAEHLAENLAADRTDDPLLTAATIFPDLPTVGRVIATAGPIARVRGPLSSPSPDCLPLWRETLLRYHLLTQFPTWQRLAQRSDRDALDPDPLILAMVETACTLIAQWEQPESWLLPPALAAFHTTGGCSLGELLLGLFWSVTRSGYAIAQLVGGVSAQVLQPEQGWQTGTLRLLWMLTITTDAQAWCWDLTTRQLLTTIPPALDPQAVICWDARLAYPTPLRVATLQTQIRHQLQMNAPQIMLWEQGLPLAWQAHEATTWQAGQWQLTSNLEFVATD